jgi:ParB family chromosome partitioning protein
VPLEDLRHSLVCPRWTFDEKRIACLASSITERGVLQPLLVRPILERGRTVFEVVIGERRFRALRLAGMQDVPVIVREMTDAEARRVWLIKIVQREDVGKLEQTEAIRDLLEFELSLPFDRVVLVLQKMLAEWQRSKNLERLLSGATGGWELAEQVEAIVGFFRELGSISWQGFLTNRVYLLRYPEDVLELVRSGQLSMGAARWLAKVSCPLERGRIRADLAAGRLRGRRLESRVNQILGLEPVGLDALLDRLRSLESRLSGAPVPDGVLAELSAGLTRLERVVA